LVGLVKSLNSYNQQSQKIREAELHALLFGTAALPTTSSSSSSTTATTTPPSSVASSLSGYDLKMIETSHPYESSVYLTKTLKWDDVSFFVLTFDPRSTALRQDHLTITDQNGHTVCRPTGDQWPKHSIIVRGNKVSFSWAPAGDGGRESSNKETTASSASAEHQQQDRLLALKKRWGFRCFIQVVKNQSLISLPWSADLLASIANLVNRSVSTLLFQRPALLQSSSSVAVRPPFFKLLLNSDIFAYGLKPTTTITAPSSTSTATSSSSASPSARDAFLHSLLEYKETKVIDLISFLKKKIMGRPLMAKPADLAVSKMEARIFAVLLHHFGLVDAAMNVSNSLSSSTSSTDSNLPLTSSDFLLVRKVWERVYRIDQQLLNLVRSQKQWQDLMTGWKKVCTEPCLSVLFCSLWLLFSTISCFSSLFFSP
jgi:hypothetical protein